MSVGWPAEARAVCHGCDWIEVEVERDTIAKLRIHAQAHATKTNHSVMVEATYVKEYRRGNR